MAKIHELIPVEQDKTAVANSLVEEGITTFTKKIEHFQGHVRKTVMYDAERQLENTSEIKEIVETVPGKLAHIWEALGSAIDVTLAKENSNTSSDARADVIVGSKVILVGLPATALLALEKKLGVIKNLYAAIPTLDPTIAWAADDTAALPGAMRSVHQQEGHKTEKSLRHKVLYEATKEHPAQIEKYTIDTNVAKVTVDRQSGMVSPAQKALWLRRVSDLQTAVKEARQRANMAEVIQLPVASDIYSFIHA